LKTKFISDAIHYDGSQLRSLYAYLSHGVLGDSVIAWVGPCRVTPAHMIDGEDLLANAEIRGDEMLHFVIECFQTDLFGAVALQRLFAASVLDCLRLRIPQKEQLHLRRDGDDLFLRERKLSISIATKSPVSTLIHFAINCKNDGTPVATAALGEWGVDAREFASTVMSHFKSEFASMVDATMKVRPAP